MTTDSTASISEAEAELSLDKLSPPPSRSRTLSPFDLLPHPKAEAEGTGASDWLRWSWGRSQFPYLQFCFCFYLRDSIWGQGQGWSLNGSSLVPGSKISYLRFSHALSLIQLEPSRSSDHENTDYLDSFRRGVWYPASGRMSWVYALKRLPNLAMNSIPSTVAPFFCFWHIILLGDGIRG